jgi:Tol biopolymer transport system component
MRLIRFLFSGRFICLAAGFWIPAIINFSQIFAQNTIPGNYRPPLFFREDWKETLAATPVTQQHVSNSDLLMNLYGAGCDSIKKSHHDTPVDDPYYIWSGLCLGNWAVTLKHRTFNVDLASYSKIVWRSKQSGLRELHIILKLADGTWLVSDKGEGESKDWRICEFNLADIRWYKLDIKNVIEGAQITSPDLSKVEEVGFTDLMRGGQSIACSRLDWIEVFGKPVKR